MSATLPAQESPKPDTADPYPFRLALSYQHSARGQLEECERAFAEKRLEADRYPSVRGFYESHLKQADDALEALRLEAREHLQRTEALVAGAQADQTALGERVTQGRTSPEEANDHNKVLQTRMTELLRQSAQIRATLEASDPETLGGFVRLALEEYPAKLQTGKPDPRSEKRSNVGRIVSIVVSCIVVGLGLGVFSLLPATGKLEIDISPDTNPSFVNIIGRNEGAKPAILYVPWPDGTGRVTPEGADPDTTFGIQLFVKETASTQYRLLPSSEGAWRFKESRILGFGPVIIQPGLSATVTLDTTQLVRFGVDVESVRLVVTDANGTELSSAEANVPKA